MEVEQDFWPALSWAEVMGGGFDEYCILEVTDCPPHPHLWREVAASGQREAGWWSWLQLVTMATTE